jgi:hypothetical protein
LFINAELPGEVDDERLLKTTDLKTKEISSALSDTIKRKKRKRKYALLTLLKVFC